MTTAAPGRTQAAAIFSTAVRECFRRHVETRRARKVAAQTKANEKLAANDKPRHAKTKAQLRTGSYGAQPLCIAISRAMAHVRNAMARLYPRAATR